MATIRTVEKNHFLYGRALFQYLREDLEIPAKTVTAEKKLGEQIYHKLLEYLTNTTVHVIAETLRIINTDIKHYIKKCFSQTPKKISSNSIQQLEGNKLNPQSTRNQDSFPQQLHYITRHPKVELYSIPPETHWTKSLEEYGQEHVNLRTTNRTKTSSGTVSPFTEEATILQLIDTNPLKSSIHQPDHDLRDITKLEKFSGEENNAYLWIAEAKKTITTNNWDNDRAIQALLFFLTGTADSWYQSLAEKPTNFATFKLIFLQYFCDLNTLIRLQNQFSIIKQKDYKAAIERDYYTAFMKQEANHTQAINLTINEDFWPVQPEPISHPNKETMTTITNTNSNRVDNNDNNLGNLIFVIVITVKNWVMLYETVERKQPIRIKEASINIKHNTSQPQNLHIMSLNTKINTHPNCFQAIINFHHHWLNQHLTKAGKTASAPTRYSNQASYLGLIETQNFCNATFAEGRNVSKVSNLSFVNQPLTTNIPPTTITEDMTLAAIFFFNIDSLKTTNLFSGTTINPDKPIMAMYADAKVGTLDIKLILDNGSTGSIIMKQLMDQLGYQVDHAATTRIITVNGNTKTLISKIDNFLFEINRIQIPTKVLVTEVTQYQALIGNNWLSKANAILDWNTQELQIMFNGQHVQVPIMCGYFKTQDIKPLLIKFKDTIPLPIIETYQLSPPPTWEKKGKKRAEEESPPWGYPIKIMKNGQPPPNIIVDFVCWKDLGNQNNKILPDEGFWNDVSGRGGTCDKLYEYLHDEHKIWRITSTKAKDATLKNLFVPEYNEPDYITKDFFTDNLDAFQNHYQELALTRKEQKQRLADLNMKLYDYCLILCHFQYCDECDLMFNPLPKTLYSINELPESKEEAKLIVKDMLFQEPNKTTETKQYFYSNNNERICPKKAHDTNAGFDLQYSEKSPLVIAPHFLISIDLKIALEILVSTMVQVAFRSSLAKKGINVKGGIINAKYTENIIVMLQNNSDRSYKIESHDKIIQAIFLPLMKIPQLTLVTTHEKLGLTAQGINGFRSNGKKNVLVNLTEEDSDQVELIYTNTVISIPPYQQYILKVNWKIQDQALLFEANPEICSLADITNLYLSAKAYKHFKIPIYNPIEDVIEIPEKTLISSISTDIQNPKKLQFIPDFTQLFLFCDIISQVWNLPKESYLFTPEKINKLNLGNLNTLQQMQFKVLLNQYANVFASENEFGCINIMKHQIDTGDT
ncbi:hypothetical protein G9A89_009242 [Geosiphon pyriformis]|nr:hypothetical protein G9A89_009242 [Geosiphon pyriformis]